MKLTLVHHMKTNSVRESKGKFSKKEGKERKRTQIIQPADQNFRKILTYRTYRLDRVKGLKGEGSSTRFKQHREQLQYHLKALVTGDDPIQILVYLSVMVTRCELLRVSEMEANTILSFLLNGSGEKRYESASRLTKNSLNDILN